MNSHKNIIRIVVACSLAVVITAVVMLQVTDSKSSAKEMAAITEQLSRIKEDLLGMKAELDNFHKNSILAQTEDSTKMTALAKQIDQFLNILWDLKEIKDLLMVHDEHNARKRLEEITRNPNYPQQIRNDATEILATDMAVDVTRPDRKSDQQVQMNTRDSLVAQKIEQILSNFPDYASTSLKPLDLDRELIVDVNDYLRKIIDVINSPPKIQRKRHAPPSIYTEIDSFDIDMLRLANLFELQNVVDQIRIREQDIEIASIRVTDHMEPPTGGPTREIALKRDLQAFELGRLLSEKYSHSIMGWWRVDISISPDGRVINIETDDENLSTILTGGDLNTYRRLIRDDILRFQFTEAQGNRITLKSINLDFKK